MSPFCDLVLMFLRHSQHKNSYQLAETLLKNNNKQTNNNNKKKRQHTNPINIKEHLLVVPVFQWGQEVLWDQCLPTAKTTEMYNSCKTYSTTIGILPLM